MTSTSDTSFISIEGHCRLASTSKPVSLLPSSQVSDTESDEARDCEMVETYTREEGADEAIGSSYQTIWRTFCGQSVPDPYPTFHLSQASYERLHQRLDRHPGLVKHFVEGVRKDWDASTGCLVLRQMATAIHNVTKRGIEAAIEAELASITRNLNLPYKILSGSHTKIQKRHTHARVPYFDKSPDGQFYYDCAAAADSTYRYPPFVFEVAYSQEGRDVQEVAKSFLRNMPAKICSVLAIEIVYHDPTERKEKGHHSASLTLWTTEEQELGIIAVDCTMREFRDKQGKALPGELILPFKSFLPLEERGACPEAAGDVHLSFAFLSELIDTAERRQRLNDASPSPEPAEKIKTIRWRDEDGDVTEQRLQEPKRQRTEVPIPLAARMRSSSQPRRSSRLRLSSRGSSRAVSRGSSHDN